MRDSGPKQTPPGVTAAVHSEAPLAKEASYTSEWIVSEESDASIVGTVVADKAGVIHIEQSSDGVNADVDTSYEIPANDGKGFAEDRVGRYWRIRYVNGAAANTLFRLSASARRG